MKDKIFSLFLIALGITCLSAIVDVLGIAFLILKMVSVPFVPNRNIDDMSDYYTAVWESVKGNSVDNGKFAIIDVSENSRREIAEILTTIKEMDPKIIGLDVTNTWEEDKATDSLFVKTIQSISHIVLPVEYHDTEPGSEVFLYNIFHNRLANKKYGVVSFPDNRDILRTYRPSFNANGKSYDAFGCILAKECGVDLSNIRNKENMLINYTTLNMSDDDAIPGYQLLNLCNRDSLFIASEISNKIVLIGSTHLTSDHHLTPLGYSLSGVMIHAHIANTLLENKSIMTTPLILRYFFCFVIAFSVLMWNTKRNPSITEKKRIWKTIVKSCLIFFASILLFAGFGTILFSYYCYYIDFAPYIVTLIVVYIIKDKNYDFKKLCKH